MSLFTLPDQTIPETEKDKQWHIDHPKNYVTFSGTDVFQNQKEQILSLYRAYNAELTEEELQKKKSITCPHGYYLGVDYVVYPLIQSKIEQMVGEFLLRPLRRKAYVTDSRSKNKKFEAKLKAMSEEIMRDITQKMEKDLGFKPQTENPDMQLAENVEEFFESDFKMLAEEIADELINIFLDVRKEKSKFRGLFTDYCISDRAHMVLDKKNGFTTGRKVHTLDAEYDLSPYQVVQDDHEFFFENYYLTENEIYNTFTSLTKEQRKEVRCFFEGMSASNVDNPNSDSLEMAKTYKGWFNTTNKTHRMRLVSAMWKSRKRVSIKKSVDKRGNEHFKKLDDSYKPRKKDVIENIDGEVPRYCIMLGPDICLEWGECKERFSPVDNPYVCTLPVVSIVRDNTTGSSLIKSVASKLFQLQEIASEILFEIRLALKNAGDSRVLVYDAAQTPKEFSKGSYENGLNRVMHHIKKDKMMIINSKQKGAQSSFNQFTSLDLSQKGAIQDLFNGLAIIEDLAAKFVGISPEREGQVGQYQTATGVDKAIRGSSARTEVIFSPFDEFIQAILEKVLLRAKHDYKKGEVLSYILGEHKTKFLKLFEDFFASDYGIYLSDPRKDLEQAQRIDAAAEMALSNANTPEIIKGLIEVFHEDTAVEKKMVFDRMLTSMEKLRKESEQAAQEQAQAAAQADQAKTQSEADLKREGFQNNIDVAEIYVQGKAMSDAVKNMGESQRKLAELDESRDARIQQAEAEKQAEIASSASNSEK